MWLLNQFPKDQLDKAHGFKPDDAWLEHVRLSSARLAQGCSASFVSPSGLVMTNHHCAHACIEQLSTAQRDYVKSGFYAKGLPDEVKCPALEVNQLVQITDVSPRVRLALKGLSGEAYVAARKAEYARIEKECVKSDSDRCDVVSLYHGGLYHLYRYRRYQDVRLVFAPEFAIAFFGGDPDNFNFPRYDLDLSFLRVYADGKPLQTKEYFRFSKEGPKDGELTFVTGHPGGTSRQLTLAELVYQRDVVLPENLLRLAELRGLLEEFQARGPEQARVANDLLFGVENSFKAIKGRQQALLESSLVQDKATAEAGLKKKLAANTTDPTQREASAAFAQIEKALVAQRALRFSLQYEEQGRAFFTPLYGFARTLVRAAAERQVPNEKRLPEFRDAALPQLTQQLFSPAPIYSELEIEKLTFSLPTLRETLGADDAFVKVVLGKESPREMATRLVTTTTLRDVAVRKALWDGGAAAIAASTDPFIVLARRVDSAGRSVRKRYEDTIESVLQQGDESISRARFAVLGTSEYPDATFTLRISFGTVTGFQEGDHFVPPFTTLRGAFARDTGAPPFDLPRSWLSAREKLNLDTPLNFCSTNDIIGGNSGSPVIDRNAQVVGLIFDGNIHSLGGDFGYDPVLNRAVAVDSAGILEALSKVYGAQRLVDELGASASPRAAK
jgi:Peptidase S46